MAVPNTSTFTLGDVVKEINPVNESLAGCIAEAIKTGWVISYMGGRDRLSNFRG